MTARIQLSAPAVETPMVLDLRLIASWAVIVGIGALMPVFIHSNLVMTLLTQAVITGVGATSVGFLARQSGLTSFGHAAFFGMAAYTLALLMRQTSCSVEIAIILSLAFPTLIAFLLGLVIVRVPGVAFSMLTLAVGQACYEFAMKARGVTGGEDGVSVELPTKVFGLASAVLQRPQTMFAISWAILCLLLIAIVVLSRSNLGRLSEAIRENEERARFIGYETLLPRAIVFSVSALIAAVGGVLFAVYNSFVSPDVAHWSLSGSMLLMAVIGGVRLIWGPAFGAVVFFLAKDAAGNVTEHWQAIVGLILIFVTIACPDGIGSFAERTRWLVRGGERR